jgi:hypothetical protein
MAKSKKAKIHEHCGTRLRGRDRCPRGPGCIKDEEAHNALSERVKEATRDRNR